MSLPEGATLGYGEAKRIDDAIAALKEDVHAPRSITVSINLHVHREYPKHIAGKLVNSAEEEKALIAASKPKCAAKPQTDETPAQ